MTNINNITLEDIDTITYEHPLYITIRDITYIIILFENYYEVYHTDAIEDSDPDPIFSGTAAETLHFILTF